MEKHVRKQIKEIKFELFSPEQIRKISAAKIVTPELYDIDGYPVDGGLMDLRLGAVDPGVRCRTCGGKLKECLGHPGSIDLARPVIHLKYIPLIELGLRSFCHDCGKLKLNDKDLDKYGPSKRAKRAKDKKKCPHCNVEQEKIKLDKPTSFYRGKKRIFPTEIREMLAKIPDEEFKKIGVNPKTSRPEWAILTMLLVPAVTVRPSIILESGERSEDDLTHKLSDIIRANQRLWENLNAGAPEVIIEDLWDLLQYHVTTFFDNTVARVPPARHRSGQPLKTITERIKGKEGRIRKNLAGKRVNFSGRTVISPDPYLDINEIGVPYEIAKIITVAETVTDLNMDYLKRLIKSETYPGANYIIRPDGKRKKITAELREEILQELEPGYKVERHLIDGDVVLFNRHPSLHRGSLMAHYVRVLPHRTFRLHPAAADPYNADFDGDEMNIHSPQTEEARSEAKVLLEIKHNLISPKNNTNFFGNIADAVTGNYILGMRDLTKDEADQLLFSVGIEPKITKKNISGKEIISELLPKDFSFNDEGLKIEKGEIKKGDIDENTFGVEDGILVRELDKEVGRYETIKTLKKVFTLGTNYLTRRGITVSVEDFDLDQELLDEGEKIIQSRFKKVDEILESYEKGTLEIIPGKTVEESRELNILKVLNEVRTEIGKVVKDKFPEENPASYMIKSGGAGNMLQVTQMAVAVGQQALSGGRIDIGFTGRTLSSFKQGDLSPRARGFIKSPFIKGLRPDEFFFGAITGRDSLMDTALRTPKSGYLYRRLASALQDLRVEYDKTVRDGNNNVIQFMYGDDGKDVSRLHMKKQDVDSGEAVGIVAAQSFGESSTQMVLNTFHMAGVAEMQVTSGLPRLIEIFDARKKPSSPMMEIYLNKDSNNEKDSQKIAERIKEVSLKEVTTEISVDFSGKKMEVKIDDKALKDIGLNSKKVMEKIRDKGHKVRDRAEGFAIDCGDISFREIYKLKEKIKGTVISGIKGIKQILIVKRDRDYVIQTLGTNLAKIIELKEVNENKTISNDFYEVADVFGIEAARQLVINEVQKVLETQGLDIDIRHQKLIADAMTHSGEVKGVTRMGIIAQKTSILARATFETPVKQFINASIKGNKDKLASVIENIILNQPVPIGTGLPGLLVEVTGPLIKDEKDKKTAKSETVDKANK